MGFLAPLFLALGLGAAVPLLIHLLRRRTGVRIEFPAARYLARAEQEHSRRLKLRNLLLMMLRVLAIACIALAAAQPVSGTLGRLVGAGHAPAAIGIVLDNSLSTSVIANGRPVLDGLKAIAARAARGATAGDRVWLVTADGRTQGGTPAAVASAIARTEPLSGAGDLPRAAGAAAGLVRSAGVADPVVAIVTDGQATAWSETTDLGGVRIVVYAPAAPGPPNRAVVAAAARPARWTPRGEVTATVQGTVPPGGSDSTTYRIGLGTRTLARGTVAVTPIGDERASRDSRAGGVGAISVHAAPPERGWAGGSVEIEADELRGDDVRYFAMWIGEPPAVAADSSAGPFVRSAVDALVANDRATTSAANGGVRTIAIVAADHLTSLPALIVPPSEPVRIGAANRALERAGVPWRFGGVQRGEITIDGIESASPADAAADTGGRAAPVTATLIYAMVAQGTGPADTLARSAGKPWAVAGPGYVLIASPADPASTSLPLRAVFVPWVGDLLAQRLVGTGSGLGGVGSGVLEAAPGETLRRPAGAEELEAPDGAVRVLSGATIDAPGRPGVYFIRRAGARVGALVVNPPPRESDLTRLAVQTLATRFRGRSVLAGTDGDEWVRAVFDAHAARPLARIFLVAALVALLAESLLTRRAVVRSSGGMAATRRAA
jgi:Aerotolerance regulator N-terminal